MNYIFAVFFIIIGLFANEKEVNKNNKSLFLSKNGVFYKGSNIFKTHLRSNIIVNKNYKKHFIGTNYYLYISSLENKNDKQDTKNFYSVFFPDQKYFLEGVFASFLKNKRQDHLKTTRFKKIYSLGIMSLMKDVKTLNIYSKIGEFKKKLQQSNNKVYSYLILNKEKKENKYIVREVFCKNVLINNNNKNYFLKLLKTKNIISLNKNPKALLKNNNVAIFCQENIYQIKNKNDIKKLNKNFLKKGLIYNAKGKELKTKK